LYARAGTGVEPTRFRYARDGDVAAFSWVDGTLSYVVIATTSEERLLTVAQAVDQQIRSRP
jgi:anti-sigma factor RsiW